MDLSTWEEELTGAFETPNLPRWCQPHMYNDFQISHERYEELLLSQSGPDYNYNEEALAHWGQLPSEVTFNNDDLAFPTIESLRARRRSARSGSPEYLSQEPNDMQQQASTEREDCQPAESDADASSRVAAASFKPDLQQEKNGEGSSSDAGGASSSMPDSSNQAASDVSEASAADAAAGLAQPTPLEIIEEIMRLSEPREIVRLAATCKSLAARSRGIVKASAMQERFNRGVVCPTYRWTLVPRGPHKSYAFRLDSR